LERESILGSAFKRLALIEATAGRTVEERKAIEAMNLHYQRATSIGRDSGASDLFYPALNYMAAEAALHAGRREWKGFEKSLVDATRASLEAKGLSDPDFWCVVGDTELEMYEALVGAALATARGRLEKGFDSLHRKVTAPWMWSSVNDNAQFVLSKYKARASAKESKAAEGLLNSLRAFAYPE
jgi:hypothetical protein